MRGGAGTAVSSPRPRADLPGSPHAGTKKGSCPRPLALGSGKAAVSSPSRGYARAPPAIGIHADQAEPSRNHLAVPGARAAHGGNAYGEEQLSESLGNINLRGYSPSPRPARPPPSPRVTPQPSPRPKVAEEPVTTRRRRRFSRGASLTPYVPGAAGGNGREEKNILRVEDDEIHSPLPSDIKPYVADEVPYLGPVAPVLSTGSKLRLIAFDFDQTLAATHLFFRLKNQQSRARGAKMVDGRHAGPPLVKLLLSGAVPFEEIWGGQERLDYLKSHLQELSDLGVYMVVITKGTGRVVDLALQLAGLRGFFQAVLDPKTATGAKLMTVQVLMNTALGERLRPIEAALVDDELKNLIIDISPEELAALPPVFQAAEPVGPHASGLTSSRDFEEGHLVGPVTVCRLMRAEHGVKSWQLRELVNAASSGFSRPQGF